uniref:Photosystem II reaction center protein T n=1 Tax=Alexandrium monilatum TaxID=311494 RepID=A0A7S4T9U6_9DINO
MARTAFLLAALCAAAVGQAFVPPASPVQREAQAAAAAPAAWVTGAPLQAEEDAVGVPALAPLAAGCALGAAAAWLGRRRQQLAAAGAAAATGAAPLAAHAAGSEKMLMESSVTVAGGEEALFYVFILFATLTTLVLAVVLREAPRI